MRDRLYDPYLDDEFDEYDDGDLEVDPYEQWDAWTDDLESPPTKFEGDPAVVIEPVEPVYGQDRYGRMTTSLCFRIVPHVPADTRYVLVFAVDNELNVTLVGNRAIEPPDEHEGGAVRVDGLEPHDTWVLSEEEELITLAMIYFGALTDTQALLEFQKYEGRTYDLDDLVQVIEWSLQFDDSGQVLHRLYIEEADEILIAMGWV
jgi:hypothetical protein